MSSPLENKTIRPSSFVNYSYYHGAPKEVPTNKAKAKATSKHHPKRWIFLLLIIMAASGYFVLKPAPASLPTRNFNTVSSNKPNLSRSVVTPPTTSQNSSVATNATTVNICATNTLPKLILVSISQQHLWACSGTTTSYDSPVVTGIAAHPDTITPTGTYDIKGKYTNTTLTGCDSTGCWKDPVSYWMPFLDNQYGAYGLHDATWRPNSAFGNISPDSSNGSQGCVELPLQTASWIYSWVDIGTPVTIQS